MIKRSKKILFTGFLLINIFYLRVARVKAAFVPGAEDSSDKYKSGSYSLNDLARIFTIAAQWILGIVGSLALLMFVYGGFLFLFSGGNKDRIDKGRQTLVNAVIGIFVVFLSYMIIGLVFKYTGADTSGTSWSKVNWFQ